MNIDTSSDETLTSSLMEQHLRREGGSSSSTSDSRSNLGGGSDTSQTSSSEQQNQPTSRLRQDDSPFVSMIQDGNLPVLILEKIANFCSSMDVLYLSNTCQILQQKIQNEWQGWACEYCQRPIFSVVLALTSTTGSSSTQMDITDENNGDDDETTMPLKVGGCYCCKGQRTCPECTERCVGCGITACEEGHCAFDGQMCVNIVCADDFQQLESVGPYTMLLQHLQDSISHQKQPSPPPDPQLSPKTSEQDGVIPQPVGEDTSATANPDATMHPRHRCRGCLNKCRTCEDAYCAACSEITLCKFCGESECGYCQDQCFEEYYDD
ncbi:hypothetical protein IV203_033330 [Nitzschia inconspicua]|uniref:F-box protein n=1 Tax=Nitzschia inconspicua TaxID=303405 RepID=A0A9K3KL74_9STRA|nr:hypothetical protein IV203_033330 [Nitzschia inconspicua]